MQLSRAVGAVVSSRTHAAQYCTQQFIEQFQDPALARGPYGLMVATRLPYLPAGVDQYNPEVKAIVMTIVSSSGALKVAGRHGINKSRKALRKAVTKVCVGGKKCNSSPLQHSPQRCHRLWQLRELREEQAALRRIVARATADVESRTTLLRERLTIATRLDEKAKAMTAEIEEFWRTDKKVTSCHALQPARAGAP